MPIFRCEKCGCIENTAISNYWTRDGGPALCSECDPEIAKWHGRWPKQSADGMVLASDGFLYDPEEVDTENFRWRIRHQGLKVVRVIEMEKGEGDDLSQD